MEYFIEFTPQNFETETFYNYSTTSIPSVTELFMELEAFKLRSELNEPFSIVVTNELEEELLFIEE